jgi:hypothetical protein
MSISIIAKVLTKIAMSLLTEKVFKQLIILALKHYAKSTKTKVDDELAKVVEDALKV